MNYVAVLQSEEEEGDKMKCKRIKKEIVRGRLRIVFNFVSKDCFMGRFGGGWDWKVGFQAGGKTLILSLLIFSLRFEIVAKKA